MTIKKIQEKLEKNEYSSIDQLLLDCKRVNMNSESITTCQIQGLAMTFSSQENQKKKQSK